MLLRLGGSDLVHLVDGYSQLRDAERAHQQSMLSGLTARLKAGLELPSAGVHHQQRHVGLDRIPERKIRRVNCQLEPSLKPFIGQETSKQLVGAFLYLSNLAKIEIFQGCNGGVLVLLDVTEASGVLAEADSRSKTP